MTDINCAGESKNVLINTPKLMDGLPVKLSLADRFNKSPVFSLFKTGGLPLRTFAFDYKPRTKPAEVGTKHTFLDKWKIGLGYSNEAYSFRLRRCFW